MPPPPEADSWSLGLLWGGRSRRMGTDKALLPFGDGTLIEWIARTCAPTSRRVLVACGAAPRDLPSGLRDATQVSDLVPDRGPLGGLHALLHAGCDDWLATLPCDMPLVTAADLECLLEAARAGSRRVGHFRVDGCVLPFPCVLHRSLAADVTSLLARGRNEVLGPSRELGCAVVDARHDQGARLRVNVNAPDDYQRALSRLRAEDGPVAP